MQAFWNEKQFIGCYPKNGEKFREIVGVNIVIQEEQPRRSFINTPYSMALPKLGFLSTIRSVNS